MKRYFSYGIVLFVFLSLQIFAQSPTPTPTPTKPSSDADEKNSDLVITANVRADELKFEVVPNPKVEFSSNKPIKTTWEADRENLPNQVEPGVVYRNVGIQLRIYSRFGEIQKIVIDLLDEEKPANSTNNKEPTTQPANQNNQPNNTIKPPNNL